MIQGFWDEGKMTELIWGYVHVGHVAATIRPMFDHSAESLMADI